MSLLKFTKNFSIFSLFIATFSLFIKKNNTQNIVINSSSRTEFYQFCLLLLYLLEKNIVKTGFDFYYINTYYILHSIK